MLTRRSVLPFVLGPILLRRRLRADGLCGVNDVMALDQILAGLYPPAPSGVKNYVPGSGPPLTRPTWTQLYKNPADATEYAATLSSAYRLMVERSRRNRLDPCGILFQAWLHWYRCPMDGSRPDIHSTSSFLPWHRAYLYYFERLIQTLTGKPSFRLAAWDWENQPAIPNVYNPPQPFVPFPSGCAYSRGTVAVQFTLASLSGWMQTATSTVFMGTKSGPGNASVGQPHELVHASAGNLMANISDAALDPLFFAHHANIDRFWDYWYQHFANVPHYFDEQTFPLETWVFYDAQTSGYVSVDPRQMLTLNGLGYQYAPPSNVPIYPFNSLYPMPMGNNRFSTTQLQSLPSPLILRNNDFSLPLIVRFQTPEHAVPGRYDAILTAGAVRARVGSFIVHSHQMGNNAPVFGSIARRDLKAVIAQPSFSVTTAPAAQPLSARSVELQYPSNPADWNRLV